MKTKICFILFLFATTLSTNKKAYASEVGLFEVVTEIVGHFSKLESTHQTIAEFFHDFPDPLEELARVEEKLLTEIHNAHAKEHIGSMKSHVINFHNYMANNVSEDVWLGYWPAMSADFRAIGNYIVEGSASDDENHAIAAYELSRQFAILVTISYAVMEVSPILREQKEEWTRDTVRVLRKLIGLCENAEDSFCGLGLIQRGKHRIARDEGVDLKSITIHNHTFEDDAYLSTKAAYLLVKSLYDTTLENGITATVGEIPAQSNLDYEIYVPRQATRLVVKIEEEKRFGLIALDGISVPFQLDPILSLRVTSRNLAAECIGYILNDRVTCEIDVSELEPDWYDIRISNSVQSLETARIKAFYFGKEIETRTHIDNLYALEAGEWLKFELEIPYLIECHEKDSCGLTIYMNTDSGDADLYVDNFMPPPVAIELGKTLECVSENIGGHESCEVKPIWKKGDLRPDNGVVYAYVHAKEPVTGLDISFHVTPGDYESPSPEDFLSAPFCGDRFFCVGSSTGFCCDESTSFCGNIDGYCQADSPFESP